jgi:hypothetical protein
MIGRPPHPVNSISAILSIKKTNNLARLSGESQGEGLSEKEDKYYLSYQMDNIVSEG